MKLRWVFLVLAAWIGLVFVLDEVNPPEAAKVQCVSVGTGARVAPVERA